MNMFRTQNPLQWTLCSVKEGTGKGSHVHLDSHNITDETTFYPKRIASDASFEVDIPSGDFERQIEFQANLQSSDLVSTPNKVLLILVNDH